MKMYFTKYIATWHKLEKKMLFVDRWCNHICIITCKTLLVVHLNQKSNVLILLYIVWKSAH